MIRGTRRNLTQGVPALKTLFIDIETYTDKVQVYANSRWKQNIVEFDQMWRLASIAWQMEEGGRLSKIDTCAESGARGKERRLVKIVRNLFDWADLVVAHNAKFDVGKMRAKFVEYDLDPPSKYRSFCTYNATRTMGFPSKKLDDLGNFLDLGRKVPTLGKDTWAGAYRGDPESLELLQQYNAGDVKLLVALYDRIRPHVDRDHRPVISGIVPNEAPNDILAAAREAGRRATEEVRKKQQHALQRPRT